MEASATLGLKIKPGILLRTELHCSHKPFHSSSTYHTRIRRITAANALREHRVLVKIFF